MTDRQQTNRDAAEAELFRLLVENVRDYAIFVVDPEGLVRSWNPGAQRLLGYSEEEIIGRSAATFFTPQDVGAGVPQQEMARAVATGRGEDERWHLRKDGSRFWSGGTITPLWDEGRNLQGFARIMRDRTTQKDIADSLRDALAYAEGVVETVREPLLVLGGDLRIKTANRSFYRTFRVSAEETEGRLIYDLGNRQWDIPLLRTLLEEILPKDTSFDGFDVEHDFADIGRKAMLLNARRLPRQDGQEELILLAIEDVTERRRAEGERSEIETRFTSLVKNIQDHAVFTIDLDGHITSWNVEAERILGYGEADILDKSFSLIFTLEDIAADAPGQELRAARECGRAQDDRWHVRRGGEHFWALGIVTPTHDARGRHTGYSKILRDRTEQKQAKQELQRAREGAETLVRERTAELRTANEGLRLEIGERKAAERRLSALHATTKVLAESPSLEAAIPLAIEAVCREMTWAWAGVWMLDERETRLGLTQFWHSASPPLDGFQVACRGKTFVQGEGVPGRVWAAGEPVWVPNVLLDEDFLGKHSAALAGLHAAVAFPILQGRHIVGVIEFFSQRVEEPDEKIFEMMAAIGTQVGHFIERKRAEEAVRASEERYRTLTSATSAIVWGSPASGEFDSDQAGWTAFTGQTVEQHRGWGWLDVVHPDDRGESARAWAAAVAGRSEYEVEHRLRRADGVYRRMSVRAVPILCPGGEVREWVGVHVDVTGRRKLEEQYRQSQKMEVVGQLAGGVAHDFNNLLTVINGYGQLLLDRLPEGDSSRAMIEEMARAGTRAAGLTRQLLAFSRKSVLAPQVLDLNVVLAELEKLLRRTIGEDVTLSANLQAGLGRVMADPGQMEQVLMNLAVNARDAMPAGGKLTIETADVDLDGTYAAGHSEVRPGRHVLLAVSDTGCGMTDEVKAHIFEPFYTTKEVGKGTGLGLSTVFGIVKQSGGSVEVYSEPGVGTSFKIYLPRAEVAATAKQLWAAPRPAPRGAETVLVVEDEDAVRALARIVLTSSGYTVLEADDGVRALRVAEGHRGPIHLLMSDVVMPELGGPALAERLVALRPEMRVLFLSGYTDDAVVRHGLLHEKVNFLQKPYSIAALAQKVRDVLDAGA